MIEAGSDCTRSLARTLSALAALSACGGAPPAVACEDHAYAFNDEMIARMQGQYYELGYLEPHIDPPVHACGSDRVLVTIREGQRSRVGTLEVEDPDEHDPARRAALRAMIEVRSGEEFARGRINDGMQRIARMYRDQGYAFVDVAPQVSLRGPVADFRARITRGPLVHVGRIDVIGADSMLELLVRMELFLHPGDLYHQTRLDRSRQRLESLGMFERVDVSTQAGEHADEVVVVVNVTPLASASSQ